ncbi:MAG: hypothetical protein ACO36A_01310 [Ilumatobacteraceae bacterium]
MKRLSALIGVMFLAAGLVACSGDGGNADPAVTTSTSPDEFIPGYTNKCEEDVSAVIGTTLLDNNLDSVKAKWGATTPLVPVFEALYDELKPAFNAGAIGIGIRYIAEYSINICRDNDLYNTVLGLGQGDAGHRDGCLDGKMPDVNEALVDCTEGNKSNTTSTTPG